MVKPKFQYDIQAAINSIALANCGEYGNLPEPPEIEHDCENLWHNLAPYLQTGVITPDLVDWIAPCDECLRKLYIHIRDGNRQKKYMIERRNDRFGTERRVIAATLNRQIKRALVLYNLAFQTIPKQLCTPRPQTER